jgi:uncharacterized protein YecT (DUF1311 family)
MLLVPMLLTGGFAAGAAEPADCSNAVSQPEINACEYEIFRQADASLNRVYAQLAAKLDPDARKLLRDAERAWLDFRDKECESQTAASAGGSIRPMYMAQCQTALTKQRIRELEAQRDCRTELCSLE